MPIVVNDYDWSETPTSLTITIPLRGLILDKTTIFNSTKYIKLTYKHYIFEVILLHETRVIENKCTITPLGVIFELVKCEKGMWGDLEPKLTKSERQQLKLTLIEEEYKRFQKENEEKANIKHELKRVAVREQIKLDTYHREHIEQIRNEEKTKALGDLECWRNNFSKKSCETKMKKNNITPEVQNNGEHLNDLNIKDLPLPLPRSAQSLIVDFTPREFPTPSRESRLEEENEWLRKQAESRRTAGFICEDIRPEEKNPQFMKAKGDEFMKNENYKGAISAYSFGIKLSESYADLYIARSEAHLLMGNYAKTIEDCSKALELLKPEVIMNLKERSTCIGRRGVALCKFGYFREGTNELKACLRLLPDEHFSAQLKLFQEEWESK